MFTKLVYAPKVFLAEYVVVSSRVRSSSSSSISFQFRACTFHPSHTPRATTTTKNPRLSVPEFHTTHSDKIIAAHGLAGHGMVCMHTDAETQRLPSAANEFK
jgi:hypothetical protein